MRIPVRYLLTPPPVARVSPPAISFSDAGGDTATNSAQAPGGYRVTYLPVGREGWAERAPSP
jgi:hypothetical protein